MRVSETFYHELSSCRQGLHHSERWIKAWPRRRSADSAHSLRKLLVLLGGSRAEILNPRKALEKAFAGVVGTVAPKPSRAMAKPGFWPDPHWPLRAGPLSILPSWTLCFHSTQLTGGTGRFPQYPFPSPFISFDQKHGGQGHPR